MLSKQRNTGKKVWISACKPAHEGIREKLCSVDMHTSQDVPVADVRC